METSSPYRFGDFELDVDGWELRKAGRQILLQPRQLQLLICLVRHYPRLVTKAELRVLVWRGVKVSDSALWTAVYALRRAIGDTARPHSFILTRHGLGVRFATTPLVRDRRSQNQGAL